MTEAADGQQVVRGALPTDTILADRYRILRPLGEGSSGIVYLAECVAGGPVSGETPVSEGNHSPSDPGVLPGQQVALKVVHRHLLRDRQINRRFHREARILRKLRGKHLVPLLDFGEAADGQLYMALELVDGQSLIDVMKDDPLEPSRAVDLLVQICSALETAHAANVVHRDLKPGNVVLELTDQGERVRVLDFGMAKMVRGEGSESLNALTEQNMVFGTPEYMAPEQARGEEVDARCDVYAAGVILYEMLTGSVPFEANSPIGIMTAHLTREPEPPSSRLDGAKLPPALEAAVMHALAKRPAERYPTAADLARALSRALERPADVASTAPPPSMEEEVVDDDLATRDTETAMGVHPSLRPTEPSPSPGETEHTRPSKTWIAVAVLAALIGIAMGVFMSLMGGR